eukprot:m.1259756 g.1259756  ORF g.1259756 m.1259756 type:complete len:199 (-) comp24725_c0_seq46:4235-4831(-)
MEGCHVWRTRVKLASSLLVFQFCFIIGFDNKYKPITVYAAVLQTTVFSSSSPNVFGSEQVGTAAVLRVELGEAPEAPIGMKIPQVIHRRRRATSFDATSRNEVALAFLRSQAQIFTAGSAPGWTGDVSTCDAGTTTSAWRAAVVSRLNLYRELIGLDNVTEHATLSARTQQGIVSRGVHSVCRSVRSSHVEFESRTLY